MIYKFIMLILINFVMVNCQYSTSILIKKNLRYYYCNSVIIRSSYWIILYCIYYIMFFNAFKYEINMKLKYCFNFLWIKKMLLFVYEYRKFIIIRLTVFKKYINYLKI
jgi:hypothetical protein